VPKVIDFGIAKATQGELTDKTIYTQFHQFIGTPAYLSPEQAEMSGLDIDTRTDIYSLGVLLYELLTGSTPFDTKELMKAGLDEMRRIIREVEPARPSTRLTQGQAARPAIANRKLQIENDLDWIVMKCLEKDRTRRYETANGLAQDIRRHLNDEPVLARPPSALYRFQKAYRRHKLGWTAAAAVVAALVGGLTISLWQAVAAQKERDRTRSALVEVQSARDAAEAAFRDFRQHIYVSDVQAAFLALENQNFRRARDLLARHRGDSNKSQGALAWRGGMAELRGFEWRYLWQQSQGITPLVSFRPHADSIEAIAWSHDGGLAATVGDDQIVRVWQTGSWQAVTSLSISSADSGPPGRN
jgi:eukaryotic-like serine/threonine-protein kinase